MHSPFPGMVGLFTSFPPFSLQKLEKDQALALLVAPIWPTQVWWPQLIRLLVATPLLLPQHKDLLSLPHSGAQHPLRNQMRLMACLLSDNTMKQEEYRSQLLDYSCHLGEGGTRKQYSGYIKKWTAFCLKRKVSHLQPTIGAILDFLSELYDQGLTYSAINCARSALSSYVSLCHMCSVVGQNPLVCRLLNGVFQSRPPKPKYAEVWDVQVVLTYLATLHPVESLTLKELTFKLVTLLLLVSGQRGHYMPILPTHPFAIG